VAACAVVAAPAAAAPPTTAKHAKHPHAKHAHGKHANRAKHPHRPAHPGAAKGGQHGKKKLRVGHHGERNLPTSIAPPPKPKPVKLPTGNPAKTAALWATPVKVPKTGHKSHARVAPTWMIAIPGAALAVLAIGGLVHLARRWRRPTPAAS
jgi:hypothetical protein